MSDVPEEKASHGDVDHGLGVVDALLAIVHEAAPPGHPSESAVIVHARSGDYTA